MIFHYCNNFRKELLILIENNFSHLLHYPRFYCVLQKIHIAEISTYPWNLRYNVNLNQNWRKINIQLSRAMIWLFLVQKWIFHNFSVKSSKCLTANWFVKLSENWNFSAKIEVFRYCFQLLDNTFDLLPHLLKSDK